MRARPFSLKGDPPAQLGVGGGRQCFDRAGWPKECTRRIVFLG